jgi:hypothetical protein
MVLLVVAERQEKYLEKVSTYIQYCIIVDSINSVLFPDFKE